MATPDSLNSGIRKIRGWSIAVRTAAQLPAALGTLPNLRRKDLSKAKVNVRFFAFFFFPSTRGPRGVRSLLLLGSGPAGKGKRTLSPGWSTRGDPSDWIDGRQATPVFAVAIQRARASASPRGGGGSGAVCPGGSTLEDKLRELRGGTGWARPNSRTPGDRQTKPRKGGASVRMAGGSSTKDPTQPLGVAAG